jgi:hypothetical protein
MPASAALPRHLQHKINSLARRIRFLRALHGGSLLLIALVGTMSAAVFADYSLDLRPAVRLAFLLTWGILGIASAVRGIVLPLCCHLGPEVLAALIEERYPELGERLTSAVELAGSTANYHGSPELVALLIEETEARTHDLNFFETVPARPAIRLATAATLLLLLAGSTALLWPRYSVELGQRFLLPWRTRGTQVQHQTTAIEPVALVTDSPTIVITPPGYAKNSIEEQTIHGLADLTVLQHSRIHFDFRFIRPARTAVLEWPAAADHPAPGPPWSRHPLTLTEDGCGASCELAALASGSYRLVLEGEHGIRTELQPRLLNVHVDQPPAFRKIVINDKLCVDPDHGAKPAQEQSDKESSRDALLSILPSESLPIEIALTDDIGVERAELEYRINDGPPQRQPIPLQAAGSQEAAGQLLFRLPGKTLHQEDKLWYRIRAADNRNVPEAGLGPQVISYPPGERWLMLKVAEKAQPLRQREIVSQREELDRRLEEIQQHLVREQLDLRSLEAEVRQPAALNEKQAKQQQQLREHNGAIANSLRELARIAAEIQPLQRVADQAREVADQEMRRSDKALEQAGRETQPQPRQQRFDEADKEITSALARVDNMRRANAQLAQARLDLTQLEGLSDREQQLAERVNQNQEKEPGCSMRDQKLKREQKEIASDLQRLVEQSEPIRKALDATRAEHAQELAAQARELAQAERDLLDAERQRRQRENEPRLAELAQKQQELADRASQAAKTTRLAAQVARTTPLRPDAAGQAARALREDDTGEALRLQHQNRQELEHLAKELDQASERARQPREAARQLARLQEALRQSVNEEESEEPLRGERLDAVRREQDALSRAVENLQVPAQDPSAEKQKQEATERATQALEALENHNARHAALRMAQAVEALEQLAEQIPPSHLPPEQKEASQTAPRIVRGQASEVTSVPQGLPRHEQASQLRELAQQQRELMEAVQELLSQEAQGKGNIQENPLRELCRQEMEVIRQAAELARAVGLGYGQQASVTLQAQQACQSARETLRYMQAGAVPRAYQTGTRTAHELRKLSDQLSQMPVGSGNATSADKPEQARQLSQRQEEINRRLAALTANTDAQRTQEQARRRELGQQTSELAQDLNQLAQRMADSSLARLSVQRAAELGQRAQGAMKQAEDSDRQGNERRAREAQQEAALDLDRAAGQAELAAQQMAAALDLPHLQSDPAPTASQPGQALQQAEQHMIQAEAQLSQGRHLPARDAMQRAAQALQRAARQLAQQNGRPNPTEQTNGKGVAAAGRFDPSLFGSDAKEYAGKRWGELPGELRTKIIQDMQARYGDDYAHIIKLYFEQIADTSTP